MKVNLSSNNLGIRTKLTETVNSINNKTNLSDFNELKDYSKTLWRYTDLKSLYDKVMPSIKNFEDNMIILEKDMDRNKEIIRR